MLQRLLDDIKDATGSTLRMTSLAIAVAISLLITTGFLCAAAFIFVLRKYGPIEACLTGAGIFFIVTLIAAGCYMARKRQVARRPVEATKSAFQTALSDPMMLAAGLQVIRTIGIKKLIPILAVGGIALGLFAANRRDPNDDLPGE